MTFMIPCSCISVLSDVPEVQKKRLIDLKKELEESQKMYCMIQQVMDEDDNEVIKLLEEMDQDNEQGRDDDNNKEDNTKQ